MEDSFEYEMFGRKPEWVDHDMYGRVFCNKCFYQTSCDNYLQLHMKTFHERDGNYILYFECEDFDGRYTIIDHNNKFEPIDCTGAQAAFEDGDLKEFGDALIDTSRQTGVKLLKICRMKDPGLGLLFPSWILEAGIKMGIYQNYEIPDDCGLNDDKIKK